MFYSDPVTGFVHSLPDNAVITPLPTGGNQFSVGTTVLKIPSNVVPCEAPLPNLVPMQQGKTGELSKACSKAITSGFQSSALGVAYTYPSDSVSQTNIAYAAAHGGNLWCSDSNNVWSFVPHTMAQATQVKSDLWAFIQLQQNTLLTLQAQVKAATTVVQLQTITWP